MMAAIVDLRIQSTAKQSICTRVKRWIRRSGTCRRKAWSGWCLAGIRKSLQRSQNWWGQCESQPGFGDTAGPAGGLDLVEWVPQQGLIEGSPWSGLEDAEEGEWRSRRRYSEILSGRGWGRCWALGEGYSPGSGPSKHSTSKENATWKQHKLSGISW